MGVGLAFLGSLTIAGSVLGPGAPGTLRPDPASAAAPVAYADAAGVVLSVDGGIAAATLDDTSAAREFARMLPLRLTLHDPMGQAKSGKLPNRISAVGPERVADLDVGGIYYWPPNGAIAVVYDDLGQSVPPPGAVRLASVGSGLGVIASAGNQFTVWIDRM
jgi:hypothetical protein